MGQFGVKIVGLLLLFATPVANAQSNLACELYKIKPNYSVDFAKPSPTGWTEEKAYVQMPGTSLHYQLGIIDDILSYQNERKAGCPQAKKPLDKMYSHKRISEAQTLRVTLAIGYNDSGGNGFVWDDFLYKIFLSKFKAPCERPTNSNCGFTLRTYDDFQAILTKNVFGGKVLEIELINATRSEDDEVNRKDPEQIKMSELTQKRYHDSFSNSQFVFYLGHSRNGGGPDFAPPKLLPNEHTDYNWYQQTKINSNKMVSELTKISVQNRPLVFSILGCNSRLHYYNRLRNVLPTAGLILSREEIYTVEFYQGVLTFINGLQWQKSSEDMNIDFEAVNIAHRQNGSQEASLLFMNTPLIR